MIPEDCFYTEHHLWVKPEDGTQLVGVTEPMIRKAGALISLVLPDADDPIIPDIPFGEVEAVDDTFRLYFPQEGTVLDVNDGLVSNLNRLQRDPYRKGWLMRVQVDEPDQLIQLMTLHSYRDFVAKDLGEEYADD
jgi:glycine cleavage system H protein